MLRKPNGTPAGDIDRLMLLNIWAHHLNHQTGHEESKMLFAGLGKPSYLLNEDLVSAEMLYWQNLSRHVKETKNNIKQDRLSEVEKCEKIVKASTAIDYLLPAGDEEACALMARAMSKWYGPQSKVDAEDIIFTVGGAAAIHLLFRLLHTLNPHGKIFTPSPYYSLYHNPGHHNHFYYIDLMKEPHLRLTAAAVEKGLSKALKHSSQKKYPISGILFCDPSNPMGYVVGKQEWKLIAEVLKKTPGNIPIILDEAYAEMVFGSKHVSLFTAAPELKERLIIFRSATKGLSASGERMAALMCFNMKWREELINETVLSYAHAPKSLQIAYAKAMLAFTPIKRKEMSEFYRIQVTCVQEELKKVDFHLPNNEYHIEGTFYVLADLSAFIGLEMPLETRKVLGYKRKIKSDEDICYALLFNERIMVAPFSYFGGDSSLGYVRITCCGGVAMLKELVNRAYKCLHRMQKNHP